MQKIFFFMCCILTNNNENTIFFQYCIMYYVYVVNFSLKHKNLPNKPLCTVLTDQDKLQISIACLNVYTRLSHFGDFPEWICGGFDFKYIVLDNADSYKAILSTYICKKMIKFIQLYHFFVFFLNAKYIYKFCLECS